MEVGNHVAKSRWDRISFGDNTLEIIWNICHRPEESGPFLPRDQVDFLNFPTEHIIQNKMVLPTENSKPRSIYSDLKSQTRKLCDIEV